MQIELLKELVRHVAGKNSDIIVDILKDKKDINEFKIAEKLKLTINQTRNILYKLFANEIVSFTRKKDKRKGWYIYFWTLNVPKALQRFIIVKKKEINEMKHLIASYEHKHFYVCQGCSIEMNEENAMHHSFTCPECGKLLQLETHEKKIQELKTRIENFDKELKVAEAEYSRLTQEQIKDYEKKKIRKKKADKKERQKKKEKAKRAEQRKLSKKKKHKAKKPSKKKKSKKSRKKKGKKKGKRR
jgi:transcription factor E